MVRLAVVVSVSILISGVAEAQSPAMPEELKNAQALFQQQKYAEAAAAYEAIIKAEKGAKDPRSRAGIAASLYNLQEYARALPYAQEASRMIDDAAVQFEYPGLPPGAVWLRLARIYNKLGRSDDAFAALTTAAKYPIPNARSLEADDDLAALRSDTRWKTFWETVTSNVDPCNTAPEFRQLDFWIGEWDVLGGAGQLCDPRDLHRCAGIIGIARLRGSGVPLLRPQRQKVGPALHRYDGHPLRLDRPIRKRRNAVHTRRSVRPEEPSCAAADDVHEAARRKGPSALRAVSRRRQDVAGGVQRHVREAGGKIGLRQGSLTSAIVSDLKPRDDIAQRGGTVQLRVACAEDFGHSSRADGRHDFICDEGRFCHRSRAATSQNLLLELAARRCHRRPWELINR
jgi:tetratricopeptide (TPR) repeat protein